MNKENKSKKVIKNQNYRYNSQSVKLLFVWRPFPLGNYIYLRFRPFDWSEKQKILNKKLRNAHGKNVYMYMI